MVRTFVTRQVHRKSAKQVRSRNIQSSGARRNACSVTDRNINNIVLIGHMRAQRQRLIRRRAREPDRVVASAASNRLTSTVMPSIRNDEHIIASAANEKVISSTAGNRIVAIATNDSVATRTTLHKIVARAKGHILTRRRECYRIVILVGRQRTHSTDVPILHVLIKRIVSQSTTRRINCYGVVKSIAGYNDIRCRLATTW